METEIGYGLGAGVGVVTPFAGVGLGDGGERTLRLGARWALAPGADLHLEGARSETGEADAEARIPFEVGASNATALYGSMRRIVVPVILCVRHCAFPPMSSHKAASWVLDVAKARSSRFIAPEVLRGVLGVLGGSACCVAGVSRAPSRGSTSFVRGGVSPPFLALSVLVGVVRHLLLLSLHISIALLHQDLRVK